jgi:hypothetical protein
MKPALKVIGIAYLLVSVVAIYAIVQTSVNYSMALEANVKCQVFVRDITFRNVNGTTTLLFSIRVDNPSHLAIQTTYVEFTVYLYNRSNTNYLVEAISSYASYDTMTINAGNQTTIDYSQGITAKKPDVQYILSKDPKAQIYYNFHLSYMLVKFPDWEVKTIELATYKETSHYES